MPLANLISSGIGLAAEVNGARKAHTVDKAARSRNINQNSALSPSQHAILMPPVSDGSPRTITKTGESHTVLLSGQSFVAQDGEEPPPPYAATEETDEADWQLDEAIPDTTRSTSPDDVTLGEVPRGEEARKLYVDRIVQKFLARHPPSLETAAVGNLPCPVIIPQRRPHKKSRGFVQAYAPVLAECGIDQDTFMEFHKAFFKASQVGHCLSYSPFPLLDFLTLSP